MRDGRNGIMTHTRCLALASLAALALLSCSQEEVAWETTSSVVGAQVTDQETFDNKWRAYREGVVSGLDVMHRSLESARQQTSVADQSEVDVLRDRVQGLRSDMIAEFDVPREQANSHRAELEKQFDVLRNDVETFLARLGHSPEEFSAWRSTE